MNEYVGKNGESLPQYIVKLEKTIEQLLQRMENQRSETDAMFKQLKYVQKTTNRILQKEKEKQIEKIEKQKREPKKKGFTQPIKISSILANFMNVPTETLLSRTEVTKYIILYIKDKGLENPSNRRQIWPDEALWNVLGENARKEQCLTHFNLQKYMNVHFLT
jgi:chromatin remodeling complex protein RSC6